MKTIEKLIDRVEAGEEKIRIGNHSVGKAGGVLLDGLREFFYHDTWLVISDINLKKFIVNTENGWNTQSTNRAINAYRKALKERGYEETFDNDN